RIMDYHLAPFVHYPPYSAGDSLLIVPHASGIEVITLNAGRLGDVQRIDRKGTYQPWTYQNHLILAQNPRFEFPKEGVATFEHTASGDVADWIQNDVPPSPGFVSQRDPNLLDLDGTTARLDRRTGVPQPSYPEPQQRTAQAASRSF